MIRTFYVDAARSITSRTGKRYWKCSVVENEKNLVNFANGKLEWANEAEAYAILKFIFWILEQELVGEIIVYSDNWTCVQAMNSTKRKIKNAGRSGTSYAKYINLARKLITEKKLSLVVKWIKRSQNPADYYTRRDKGG